MESRKETDKRYYQRNKERIKARHKVYRENNKEKEIARHKRYSVEHKDEITDRHQKYYEENKELVKAKSKRQTESGYDKRWREKNKEHRSAYNVIYRGVHKVECVNRRQKRRELMRDTDITIEQINELIKSSGNTCFWCDCDIPKGELHIDHVYPLSRGGGHTISNLVVSCADCNQRKHAKDPEKWLDEILQVSFED